MRRHTTIEKAVGETPLQALTRIRDRDHIPDTIPLAYAGRLDPMASGKLLVLIGDECKKQSAYHGFDKAYDFEVLLGFQSDTGDILGIAEREGPSRAPDTASLAACIKKLEGPLALPYPPFSSKTVRGKPLFLWTLEKRLDEIEIPTAATNLYQLAYHGHHTISAPALSTYIRERIDRIPPVTEASKALGEDFRRAPIRAQWQELLQSEHDYTVLKMSAIVSSGTYIRSLAPHIATLLGTTGLAYSIHRTHIGRYHPFPFTRTGLWYPNF